MINETTANLNLPLPHPQNQMAEDCQRIRQAFVMADNRVNVIEQTAQVAAQTADDAITKANSALSKAEAVEGTANTAQVAAEAADAKAVAAQGIAADATTAAGVAQTSADNANTGLAALKAQVDDAATGLAATKAIADAALPKTGGTINGTITHDLPESYFWDSVNGLGHCCDYNNLSAQYNDTKLQFLDRVQMDADSVTRAFCVRNKSISPHKESSLSMVINHSTGTSYCFIYPEPPSDSEGGIAITAAWARSHFIEQLTAERMYIGGGSSADKKVPAGGTWAYYTINMSTKGVTKGVCAGGSTIISGTDQICFAFRVA